MVTCFEEMNKPTDAKRFYRKYLTYKPDGKNKDFVNRKINNLRKSSNISTPERLR